MTLILEKLIRKVLSNDSVIENVTREMDHFLPGSGDWDRRKFEERLRQSMDALPLSVCLGIAGPSYLLRNETMFNYLHSLDSTKVAQILNASRLPLALRIDDKPRTEREGPPKTKLSLLDKEHYFENFEKQLDQKYDVIVVGSGPGGSQAAVSMLRENPDLKVLVLEAGKEYRSDQRGAMTPSETLTRLYAKGGVQYAIGKNGEPFPVMEGKGPGGGADINSGTFEGLQGKQKDDVIERHFDCDEGEYERSLATVKRDHSVSRVPFRALNKTQKNFLPLAQNLKYDARTLDSARSWEGANACTGRGACYLGCLAGEDGAKRSPHNVGLVEILNRENSFVLGDTSVDKIEIHGRKATAVAIRNKGRKYKVELEKDGVVIVAGGAIGSAKLLLDSGIPAGEIFLTHPQFELGRLNPEPVHADRGLPQGSRVLLKCGGTAESAHPSPGVLGLLATNVHGEALKRYLGYYPRMEILGAIIKSKPSLGKVERKFGSTIIRYQLSENDQKLLRETAAEMLDIWASQQGDYYYHANLFPKYFSGDSKYARMEESGLVHMKHLGGLKDHIMNCDNLFPTSSVHLFATTIKSIANHTTGRIRGLRNVYVPDTSGILQTGINPQCAIYTIADAKGRKILAEM